VKFPRLFSKKAVNATQVDTGVSPYLDARQIWNDRMAPVVSSRQMWQLIAILSLLLAMGALAGIIQIGRESKLIPYVVEVDKLGQAVAVSPAQVAEPADPRVIKATVASFISDARLVTPDGTLQRGAVLRVYAVLVAGDPATAKMNEWLNGTPNANPFKRAETEMVSVEIKSIMPQTDSTWQVDWVETVRDRKGVMTSEPFRMRALVTVYLAPPTTEEQMRKNPLGIFVRDFSWTKLS
jgi:type IV secretion system protein TrbF